MTGLADRLLAGLRAAEAARPYQLDRATLRTVAEGAEWLRQYRDDNGDRIWLAAGDRKRELRARRLLWLRWL